jgi:hypothetical protein
MRAARAGEESREPGRCGIEAGDPERRPGERIAVLDPPAAGRKGALVPSRQREPWSSRLLPTMTGSASAGPLAIPKRPFCIA